MTVINKFLKKRKVAKKKDNTEKQEETVLEEEVQLNESNQTADIEELQIELKESKDKYLRLFAEFENFKKRNTRERLELMKTAAQDTVSRILPVLDDFDRAKKSAEDENTNETLSEGVLMVYNKLYKALESIGLEPMYSNGESFDPEIHEAITEIPAPNDDMKGKVIDTVEKGYKLNDKIIRFAKVVVGK